MAENMTAKTTQSLGVSCHIRSVVVVYTHFGVLASALFCFYGVGGVKRQSDVVRDESK